jgi:acyl-coenzyme A thioesterase 13
MLRNVDEPGTTPRSELEPYARESPYLAGAVGPMFAGRRGETSVLGLRVGERHVNARGAVHGGLLSTVADVGLGHAIALADETAHPTTVSLSIDYLGRASRGGWLEVRTNVLRIGGRLAFSRAEIFCDEQLVARANGTFAMARRRPEAGEAGGAV